MTDPQQKDWDDLYFKNLKWVLGFISLVTFSAAMTLVFNSLGMSFDFGTRRSTPIAKEQVQKRLDIFSNQKEINRVEDGIHVQTGLVYAQNFSLIKNTCTSCHSAQLIRQNRATREGWKEMIRWMQATQGLWDLGNNEVLILDYLAEHYAPIEVTRRPGLDLAAIEWYILELEKE